MKHLICLLILLCPISLFSRFFHSLEDLKQYAKTHPEFPASDNPYNWSDPDYSSFHKSITPSFFRRFTSTIGLQPLQWDVSHFVSLLEKITTTRESKGLSNRHVMHMQCQPGETRIFLWSDIHAAFHSLVRDLEFLKSQNVIDNSLKIINPHHYFVFNGDYINRSVYILETLSLMLLLMEKNPQQILYLRGKHEDKNYWYNFGLKRELKIRAHYFSKEKIPLSSLINRFFDTLPLALYLSSSFPPKRVIRISHFGWENAEVKEDQLGNLFLETPDDFSVSRYNITQPKPTLNPIEVAIFIKTEDWMKERRVQQGLGLLDQELGAITWAVLSSPIDVHKKYYDFYYDAFVEIDVNTPIESSIITLYHQDIRKMKGFKKAGTYSLYSGAPQELNASPPKFKSDILIGSSMSLIGGVPSLGTRLKRGLCIKTNEINRTEYVKEHVARLFILNDDYTPSIARQNAAYLVKKEKIDLLLLPLGSPTLNVYLDYIKAGEVAVLFPFTGGPQFRKPDLKGLIHFRASYADEVKHLIEHAITELGARKFAFFYQDDAYGQGPLAAAHETLQNHHLKDWIDVAYTRATTNLKDQAQKIIVYEPDIIGFFSTSSPTQELIRQIGLEALANKRLFGISPLDDNSFNAFLKTHGLSVLLGAVVPNPRTSDLEIVQEYRRAMNAVHSPCDCISLESYIGASIFYEVVRQLDPPFTKEKILEKIESFKDYKFKGLTLTFNPQHRDLSQPIWIQTGPQTEWIRYLPKS